MPIKRFAHALERDGRHAEYMGLLVNHFNPDTVPALMCRFLVSVGWDGALYDCDFNQMLELPLGAERETIWDVDDLERARRRADRDRIALLRLHRGQRLELRRSARLKAVAIALPSRRRRARAARTRRGRLRADVRRVGERARRVGTRGVHRGYALAVAAFVPRSLLTLAGGAIFGVGRGHRVRVLRRACSAPRSAS
jgi:hypothetical protein